MNLISKKLVKVTVVIVCAMCAGGYLYAEHIHGFLSATVPVDAQILVIEGWLPDDALKKAAERVAEKPYEWVIAVGGPLEHGFFLSEYGTSANLARATLIKISNRKDIVAVASPSVRKDRTYASAVALKRWLDQNQIGFNKVNIVSFDTHARRSWYLFKKALGDHYSVGVIAIDASDYDGNRWWTSSQGFKRVIEETIAYGYTLLLFPFAEDLAAGD